MGINKNGISRCSKPKHFPFTKTDQDNPVRQLGSQEPVKALGIAPVPIVRYKCVTFIFFNSSLSLGASCFLSELGYY